MFRKRSHSESSSSSSDVSDEATRAVGHARKRTYHDRKMDEVERLAEMERQRYDFHTKQACVTVML